MKNLKSGFTLIEIMVVVVIIAALAGMILPNIIPAAGEAKKKIAMADIANISLALKLYRLHNDRYPSTSEGLDILTKPSKEWGEPYLEKKKIKDPWNNKYKYKYPGTKGGLGYDLWSAGPDGKDGTEDDINNWDDEQK